MPRERRWLWLTGVLVVMILLLVAYTQKTRPWMEKVRAPLVAGVSPALDGLHQVGLWVENQLVTLSSWWSLPKENQALRAELEKLAQLPLQNEELRQENRMLRRLLDLKESLPEDQITLAALVVGRDPDRWFDRVLINRGSRDGVLVGMMVRVTEGLVGRVVQVGSREAEVLLVSSPESGVGGKILRESSRAQGVVRGAAPSRGVLWMTFFDADADVAPGDIVVTSGLGGRFAPGAPIGTVRAVHRDAQGLSLEAEVEPAVDLNRLEWVLLISAEGDHHAP
ncbi:MAG: rod shape-determining protein MreC [Bacillota bacterium]|nr:rod shape-determining protein MreC [Bacillota bacterium]